MQIEQEIQQTNFKNPFHKAVLNIKFTANWLSGISLPIFKKYGISEEQFNVLRILKGQYPTPSSLQLVTERMLNRMSNVTRLVEKLRINDYVTREICPENRRRVNILITEKGIDLLEQVSPEIDAALTGENQLTSSEIKALNQLLDKIRQ
ncbi:MAG: MarR family transcriptional regulator [Tunicatimonas sp.]|uniref:MarR family winged helix-turn-helix transcriptional regulator n=1 Tax=Tunicatimonas sp. TaxID=1940096 RepID=UPI003C76DD69